MGDEFHRAGGNHMDVDNLALRDVDINSGVYVDKVVSGENRSLERLLHAVHRIFHAPLFRALLILEPGTAVVDCNNHRTGKVHTLRLKTYKAAELFLGHAGVTSVAVYLIEGCSEVDGGIVSLCSAQGCPDNGR